MVRGRWRLSDADARGCDPYQEDEDADGIGNLCDDVDSRFSSDKPWLLWAGIAAMVVALMGVAAISLRRH